MANELKHSSVGTELTQAEWEAVDGHIVNSQAVGDLIYAETTSSLQRLGIGSTNDVLRVTGGKPAWAAPAAAAAGSLTGATLASGVTASSLTSVGALSSGSITSGFGAIAATTGAFSGILSVNGGQIAFPATEVASAGANILDDYEEGTFTPLVQDNTFADESQAYTTQVGRYVKIGRLCFFTLVVEMSSLGSLNTTQDVFIAGFPFAFADESGIGAGFLEDSFVVGAASGLAITAGHSITAYRVQSPDALRIGLWEATTGTNPMILSELSADGKLAISGHYEV